MLWTVPLVALALRQDAAPPAPVTADPNPCLPGQTVYFYPPKGAKKVVVTGGSFAQPTDVTGQPLITDKLAKTTTYRFELWQAGGAQAAGKPAPLTPRQVSVTVDVYAGKFPPIATYFDTRNWRIDVTAGWNRYSVPTIDPVNDAVIYFQPSEDSPDRVAVAIVPVNKETDSKALLRQVLAEAPSQYDVFLDVTQKVTTQCGLPASWMTFKGIDQALAGIPTRSMVLTMVRGDHGYVISARTREGEYATKERLLRCLVRSFTFAQSPPRKPAPTLKKGLTPTDGKKPMSPKTDPIRRPPSG
jgi:hypothetical protein